MNSIIVSGSQERKRCFLMIFNSFLSAATVYMHAYKINQLRSQLLNQPLQLVSIMNYYYPPLYPLLVLIPFPSLSQQPLPHPFLQQPPADDGSSIDLQEYSSSPITTPPSQRGRKLKKKNRTQNDDDYQVKQPTKRQPKKRQHECTVNGCQKRYCSKLSLQHHQRQKHSLRSYRQERRERNDV